MSNELKPSSRAAEQPRQLFYEYKLIVEYKPTKTIGDVDTIFNRGGVRKIESILIKR